MTSVRPGILAVGPWEAGDVTVRWRADRFLPAPGSEAAADEAIAALAARGSPAHDGLSARLSRFHAENGRLELELQPMRWALRLVAGDALAAMSVLCVVRDADGRWLAGRRAPWVASWPGRWTLGAGGAVDLDEDPVRSLTRELEEEWAVVPERMRIEALVGSPDRMAMLVGQAWLTPGAEVTRDPEHDAHDWWPADVDAWPADAAPELRTTARLLAKAP